MNWRQRLSQFMMGRYGMDTFSKHLFYLSIGIYILNIILKIQLFSTLSIATLFYCYFRMFSRNVYKRANENQKYLMKTQKIRSKTSKYINRLKTMKTHHIYTCPNCKQKIRVPRGKGRICIRCVKCNHEFIKKS